MGNPDPPKTTRPVFISYANEDQVVADGVRAALEEGGVLCWIAPRDVKGGRPYSGQITQAIREAQVLLLILSAASNRSKHVLREVERAAHCQNHLLTFRIEPVGPADDLAYFLGAEHWVDGFRPLPPAQHFPTLLENLGGLLRPLEGPAEPTGQSDAATQQTFGRFQIFRHPDGSLFRLGKGGMGVTYKARDTLLNRPVALKVIASELLSSPQARNRFLREAQSAALIQHPHVATIFDFGEQGDAYFYVMEFVEGEDLERYVGRQGPLSPATALRVGLQVAQALEAAQARQVIHRDIKPANIMAISNRAGALNVKLIDFGLAKGAGTDTLDAAHITRTQDFVGSPAFASPEQCETKKLDIRSDIYSLGITLWYLLTGKRPFSGSVGEVIIAQVVKPPPFDQLAHMPEPVVKLLRCMLEKRPEDRFQSPEELQQAIEEAVGQLSAEFSALPNRSTLEQSLPTPLVSDQIPVAQTLDSASFDDYLKVEVGELVANRYRLVSEAREGNGGRLFQAVDEQAGPGSATNLSIKVLHPGLAGNPNLVALLGNELEVIRQAMHPQLVQYYSLERSPHCLVREWIHGFLMYDLLRWRRSLNPAELLPLLDPLAATLDFVAAKGLGLVDVSVRKLLVACPASIRDFETFGKGDLRGWAGCTLKLNPLTLAPLLFRSRNGWDRQTIVPASRVLSMTQAEAGLRGTKAVRLYGSLVYELVSGRAPVRGSDPRRLPPLPALDETGNEILRRAYVSDDPTYRSCQEFWDVLKKNLTTQPLRSSPACSSPAPVAPVPKANDPPAPPPVTPSVSSPAVSSAPAPAAKRFPPLIVPGAILVGVVIIGLAIFAGTRFSSNPTPSALPAVPAPTITSPSPSATVTTPSPPASATASPSSTVQAAPPVFKEASIGDSASATASSPTLTDSKALILRLLKAIESHDYSTFLTYTLDKQTDYFGHKNASDSFIQKDMEHDARSYRWCKFAPDLSTFETSPGHDSIQFDSDALDISGKKHKARCRLDIYYTPSSTPRLQSISLTVLPR